MGRGLFECSRRPGCQEHTCLRRKYGAVIVNDNRVISTGYNGSARGQANCSDIGKCVRQELNVPAGERHELCVAVHAEMNAIINGNPIDMKGATIYIAGMDSEDKTVCGKPCLMCERVIRNAQLAKVIYRDSDESIRTLED